MLIDNILWIVQKSTEEEVSLQHCLKPILIEDSDSVFRGAVFYTISRDRFDIYQKLLQLDFWIDTQLLEDILSANPKYFEYYLNQKGYCYKDIMVSLQDKLNDLAYSNYISEDEVKNIIQNMKSIDMNNINLREIFHNLIKIDMALMHDGNYSIEDEIINFLDQYQSKLDSGFTSLLSGCRLNFVKTILGKYYDGDIFVGAVQNHNFDLVEYMIQNYPITEINLDFIIGTPHKVYNLEDFEKCYSMLKLLTDHRIKINHGTLNKNFISFVELARCLKN